MDILQALTDLLNILVSPVGPPLVLVVGSLVVLLAGRWWRTPSRLTGIALFFVVIAGALLVLLWAQTEYPVYSRPWRPITQIGTNLEWFGGDWNWYISGLILLLGGIGILLSLNSRIQPQSNYPVVHNEYRRPSTNLAVHLAFLGSVLLFVNSRNLLTLVLTWVAMDLVMLIRIAVRPENASHPVDSLIKDNRAKGMSLVGALLLMIGLLPAGMDGLGQALNSPTLPYETVLLMLVAAGIRAGTYPFHLWLLPREDVEVDLSERLLDHMVPALCGLWLLGWAVSNRGGEILLQWPVLALILLMLLGSAIAAWAAPDKPTHTTFVLVTSAGLAGLAGALASNQGPSALIWPTTAFALGGGLWLVGERAWQEWGWQIPVSVGALALAGAPFTPGFLTQPAISQLLVSGPSYRLLFVIYVLAQTIQIAALLRSWSAVSSSKRRLHPMAVIRLLFACTAIGLALALSGIRPSFIQAMTKMSGAIPSQLGQYPSVIADSAVWLTLAPPLILGCLLAIARHQVWQSLGSRAAQISYISRLEWLFQASWWGVNSVSEITRNVARVIEGAGYMGWLAVFGLLGYLLVS